MNTNQTTTDAISPIASAFVPLMPSRRNRRQKSPETAIDVAASYSRYSSNLQEETSNADQKRLCREAAEKNRHRILPELEFSDSAVSGTKLNRAGLNAMLQAAERGEFKTLYVFLLSRLSRESAIGIPLFKRLVSRFGVRLISIGDGIDSEQPSWSLVAGVMTEVNSQQLRDISTNVLRGFDGAISRNVSVGDTCFGYLTEEVPDGDLYRRKNAKPQRRYIIDPERSGWVKRVFDWFTIERRSIAWIVRELNRLGVKKCHRSKKPQWIRPNVVGILSREKYVGLWRWGLRRNVRDPETGAVRQVFRSEEEVDRWTRQRPELRIIDVEQFARARELLEGNYQRSVAHRRENGQLLGGGNSEPRHLLSQLLVCDECRSRYIVGGTNGNYMFCPGRNSGSCSRRLYVRKRLAEELVVREVCQQILRSSEWLSTLCDMLAKAWDEVARVEPQEIASLEAGLAAIDKRIANVLRCVEDGEDQPELNLRLRELRAEKVAIQRQLSQREARSMKCKPRPDDAFVHHQLEHVEAILNNATPEAAYALRTLVGEIEIAEVVSPVSKKPILQGRIKVSADALVQVIQGSDSKFTTSPVDASNCSPSGVLVIDFAEAKPVDPNMARARSLHDQGLLDAEIANQFVRSRSYVSKLIKQSFAAEGMKRPNSFKRTSAIRRARETMPYQQYSDRVFEMATEGLLFSKIATELRIDRNTVTAAWRHACEKRGIPALDGRARRKLLPRKSRSATPAEIRGDDQPSDDRSPKEQDSA